ncbi:GIN domain-containing protein [Mucilaginibacter ginkgonis]|uniref:DUF2807 domain-containing protein n=1 Tax=Mucilaginibacter ginkgonis TaxID=2682091 RepID=A0A6I4I5U9_9SPHI|nr:DUF2807 domain-containing protein [Mucilaginibacter ginkgonis]QQL50474.1 DUF2807 domain-containing protein [Mucilaginibacter ginkgonis]
MKSKFLTIITVLIALISTSTAFGNNASTVLKETGAINKIEVRGNVDLYVSDATSDQIKVYNKYYAENALVQNKNGLLRITSYNNEKLVVWVSATDLRSITAYDNATVNSFGNLSKIEFNVELHNRAQANLNLETFAATLTVKDSAKANIKGTAQQMVLNRDLSSTVNSTAFVATHLYDNKPSFTMVADTRITDM